MKPFVLASVVACSILISHHIQAQVSLGMPSFSSYDCHAVDCVNLENGNVVLNTPVFSKSGAFPFTDTLFANFSVSNVGGTWYPSWDPVLVPISATPGGLGVFSASSIARGLCSDGKTITYLYQNWSVSAPNGTRHYLPTSDYVDRIPNGGNSCLNSIFTDQVIDGTGFTLSVSVSGGQITPTVYSRNGMISSGSSVVDSSGNSITQTGSGTLTFTDTLGVTALTQSGTAPALTYAWTDVNGGSPQVSQTVTSNTLKSAFGCSGITDENTANYNFVTGISYPDGTELGIGYEKTPGYSSGYYTGRLGSLTLRQGGTITYSYSGTNNGINCTYQIPPTIKRITSDGTTEYDFAPTSSGITTTAKDNGGNVSVYTFTSSATGTVLTQVVREQGSSTVLTTDVYCYNTNLTNCVGATVNYPITEVDVLHTINGMSSSSRTQTEYDHYGNVTYSAQYDFGSGSPTISTTTTYGSWNGSQCVSIGNHVNNKPCDVLTKGNSSNIAESRFTYDSHGNLLTTYIWNGSIWLSNSNPNTYNANGTVATAYDIANNLTTYSYSGTDGCNNVFPTSISKGGLTTNATWNCEGGVRLTDRDASGNVTAYGYVNSGGAADPLWRVMSVSDPLGNEVWKTYPSGSSPTTASSSFTFNSGGSTLNTTMSSDSYGRTTNIQRGQSPSPANYDTVSKQFLWSGNYREVQGTLPCSQVLGTPCSFLAGTTTTLVDPIGRPHTVTDGGGGVVTNTYTQNDVLTVLSPAPANENNKQLQTQYDGLGRNQYVCAIGNGYSTACNQNAGTANGVTSSYSYTYASGSSTTAVTRGGQTRSKTYDAMGRVTSSSTPEGGAITYTYDSYSPGTCGGWTSEPGHLMLTTTPTGAICYVYNDGGLGRITDIGISGGATHYCKRFRYDSVSNALQAQPSGSTINNAVGRLVEAETDNCTNFPNVTAITDEWFSYDKDGHMTDMWEVTPHSGQYYHSTATFYGNGAVDVLTLASPNLFNTTYSLDGEGRWNQMITFGVTIVPFQGGTFNAASQPMLINIGTGGDNDVYTYDSNTGRMKTWTFTVNSKNEAGTLTWNPNGTLNNVAITDGFNAGGTQTCYFNPSSGSGMGYDDWGRLVNDNCKNAGGTTIWTQTFSYDQYDNLTKSGTSAWNPGYNANNNHYTLGGTSYDASGNLLTDTFHTYTWNADGKIATVDSTACGTSGECVTYDALGRAVEISNGAANTEIWYTQLGKTAYMNGSSFTYAYWPTPGGGTLLQTTGYSYYFQHKDWLGNSRISSNLHTAIIDDRAFAPYGEMYDNFGSTSANELIFTGDTQDLVTGTYDSPNRELNPSQGRWLSPDPAGSGWNQYAYVTNPNSYVDPTGLAHCKTVRCDRDPHGGDLLDLNLGGISDNEFTQLDELMMFGTVNLVYLEYGSNGGTVGADGGGGTVSDATNAYFDAIENGTIQGDVTQERGDAEPDILAQIFGISQPTIPIWGPNPQAHAGCTGGGIPCKLVRVGTGNLEQVRPGYGGSIFTYQIVDVNDQPVGNISLINEYFPDGAGTLPLANQFWTAGDDLLMGNVLSNGTFLDAVGAPLGAVYGYWTTQYFSATVGGTNYVISTSNSLSVQGVAGQVMVTRSP